MADFSALKSTIQTYIKQNGNEEITGNILQEILLAMVQTMGDSAINGLVSSLSNEATTRANADTTLSNGITAINNAIQNGYVYAGIATPTGTPVSGKVFYVAIQAGTYTNFGGLTVAYGINILKYNGSAWSLDVVKGIDDEPTAGSENLVESGGVQYELALGAVYDVSAKNPTAGPNNDGKWESLSALLSDANLNTLIPTAVRKGGMSVKFVQISDNKYVQYRYMGKDVTGTPNPFLNTNNWSFCGDDTLINNPNYIKVECDGAGHLLFWIKKDGSVDWAIGVPKPVKNYVNSCILQILNGDEGTDIDGLNKVITFLDDFSTSNTLAGLLNGKVDKVEGMSLIDKEYASSQKTVNSHEWMFVETDSEDKILSGRKANGTKVEYMPTENPTNIQEYHNSYKWLSIELDGNGKIIRGIKVDGTSYSYSYEADILAIRQKINLSLSAKSELQNDLGVSAIDTNQKKQEFCSLFKNAEGEVESFIFFSDPHFFTNYDKCEMKNGAVQIINTIKDFFTNTPTDFVICGGDWLTSHKQSVAIKDLGWVDGFMNKLFPTKYYPIYGNHDNNYQGELDETSSTSANDGALSNQQMINLWFRKYGKMYYTFKGSNTKFYVFDTGLDWVTAMDSYKWEQIDWFANELLDNNDTHIVIALHIVLASGVTIPIADNILKVAEAFNNRTSITLNGNTYDFTNSDGKVHAAICGHTHQDATTVINSIPVYVIKDAQNGDFDMLLFDYSANKLKSIRVGSGNNREMNIL